MVRKKPRSHFYDVRPSISFMIIMIKLRNSLTRDYMILLLFLQTYTGKIVLLLLVFMDLFIKNKVHVELHMENSPIFAPLEIHVSPYPFQESSYLYFLETISSLWLHSLIWMWIPFKDWNQKINIKSIK